MNKIIIVGYPKSGNTWLTRLTAELVQCPVKGFLYEDNNKEFAIEGLNRKSDFVCYKSHHQLHEISDSDKSSKIIYIIRDPRDVSISGRNYFYRIEWLKTLKNKSPFLHFIFQTVNSIIPKSWGRHIMRNKMNEAVLYGNKEIHHWCRISWKKHITPYIENPKVLVVKYESLLNSPVDESVRILNFLQLEKDFTSIKTAIHKQSFSQKKKEFEITDKVQADFLRKGEKEQWRKEFTKKENAQYIKLLKKELVLLGYSLYK